MTPCWHCGEPIPTDDHLVNCTATADLDAYVEEERLGLHGPLVDAPLSDAERRFVDAT